LLVNAPQGLEVWLPEVPQTEFHGFIVAVERRLAGPNADPAGVRI
jgi:hypothetical protein